MLIRIVKSWTWPDLMRQTPGGTGCWDGVQFTLEPVENCDCLLVLNDVREEVNTVCPPENVWALFQEPYVKGFSSWMREGHKPFSRIYTHHPPEQSPLYCSSPPWVPWQVGWSFDELLARQPSEKTGRIVWVTSNLQGLPGHRKRYAFFQYLTRLGWSDLDVFGRGIRPVHDKREVLAGSQYAIAVENHIGTDYWTEKISDCWLADTLPFYYGCPNLEDYFPPEAFVRINLDDFASASSIIRRMVDAGEYEKRLSAIRDARDLVLRRHQFFPFMANEARGNLLGSSPRPIHLLPYRQSTFSVVRDHLYKRLYQLNAYNSSEYP
jgi:hypothetical protein